MRPRLLVALATAALLALPVAPARSTGTAGATAHPRLLFSAADLPALRARVATPGVPRQAWERLKLKADHHLRTTSPDQLRAGLVRYDGQNQLNGYFIELGLTYQISGDARYGRHAVELMLATADAGFPFWSGQDLGIGDLLQGIGLGFDWTYELMTPAERAHLVGRMTQYEALLFERPLFKWTNAQANNPISNWMGVVAGGAGLALLAIRGEPGVPAAYDTYLAEAQRKVGLYLASSPGDQGENQEGYQYIGYGLKNSAPFALAARREGLGDLITGTGAPKLARWSAYEQIPGEGNSFLPLNDSGRVSFGLDTQTLFMALAPEDGVTQWMWRRTVGPLGDDYYGRGNTLATTGYDDICTSPTKSPASFGLCPFFPLHGHVWVVLFYRTPEELPEVDPATVVPLTEHFVRRGLVDARSGFAKGTADVVSSFEARRNGTSHFQFDLGNFTLYGGGGHWAIDPGYSCVGCDNHAEAGYATGHNVVVVDGRKETQFRWSRYFTGTTIDGFVNAPNFSWARADLRYAYNFESPYARRTHYFSRKPGRPVVLAIGDQLQRDTSQNHTYTWQMLTRTGNRVVPSGPGFTITAPSGATLSGRTLEAGGDATALLRYQVFDNLSDDAPGAPVAYTTTAAQRAFDHLAVMALTPPGAPAATLGRLDVTGGNAVDVSWKGGREIVVSRLVGAGEVTGAVRTDAEFAAFDHKGAETLLRAGTRLWATGREYVRVTGGPATVAVSDRTATATGPAGATYRVHAPAGITTATVNGTTVTTCADGQYVSFPC